MKFLSLMLTAIILAVAVIPINALVSPPGGEVSLVNELDSIFCEERPLDQTANTFDEHADSFKVFAHGRCGGNLNC